MKQVLSLLLLVWLAGRVEATAPDTHKHRYLASVYGTELLASCTSADNTAKTVCETYIAGVVDMEELSMLWINSQRVWLCQMPLERNFVPTVVNYMRAHPEQLHGGAAILVYMALDKAYAHGCKSNSK